MLFKLAPQYNLRYSVIRLLWQYVNLKHLELGCVNYLFRIYSVVFPPLFVIFLNLHEKYNVHIIENDKYHRNVMICIVWSECLYDASWTECTYIVFYV